MMLVLTLVVRDEEDILDTNLSYHLRQGVDLILVTDHNSQDSTPEILERWARSGAVRVFREDDDVHDQARRVNRMSDLAAAEYGADWLIHADADEFWWPAVGNLKDVFSSIPAGFDHVQVERHDFVPLAEPGIQSFPEIATARKATSLNPRGSGLEPKVAHRALPGVRIGPGNHLIERGVSARAPDIGALEVFHFPIRSYEQLGRKVLNTGTGYEKLSDRGPGTGVDQLRVLERMRKGELEEHFRERARTPEQLTAEIAAGSLVEDRRLATFLCSGAGTSEFSASQRVEAVRLLAATWSLASKLAETARAAEVAASDAGAEVEARGHEISHLETQLAAARQQLDDARSELAILKTSRLFRHTASARRLYYRLRPTRLNR